MSHKKRIYLSDSDPDEHTIVFYKGEMVEILCPHSGRKKTTARKGRYGKTQKTRKSRNLTDAHPAIKPGTNQHSSRN